MIPGMLRRFVTLALLAVALLGAQAQAPFTQAQLDELYVRIDDVLGLRPSAVVADIGTGFAVGHALHIAEKIAPGGKIVCVDVRQSVIDRIRTEAGARALTNVEAVLGGDDDPKLTAAAFDAILVSNTYHEFTQPQAMLKHLREALKPGGILVVVENCSTAHRNDSRPDQTKRHDISPDLLERELSVEGFVVRQRIDPIMVETPDRFRYLFKAEIESRH